MYSFQTLSIPNPAKSSLTLLAGTAILALAACGGGGSSTSESGAQGSIQGEWQAECEVLADGLSSRESLAFEGSSVELTGIFYVGSETCSNGSIFTLVTDGSFTLPGGTTDTALGPAQHIDIETNSVEANSSPALDAQLALDDMMTFEQLLQNQLQIADTSNISPQSVGLESPFFSLILVDVDTLHLGDGDSNQGTSPETRLTELSQDVGDVFTRR